MAKENEQDFVDLAKLSVIIPYSDLEKIVSMAKYVEVMEKRFVRMEQQYTAMYGMFTECLDKIAEIREFVRDT